VAEAAKVVAEIAPVAGARSDAERRHLDAQAVAQLTGAVRLVSADAEAEIERFSDPRLLAAGKINIISLEAVQQRFADRWLSRREQVFAFAERVLDRNLSGRGVFVRVSDTDFFVVHPELGRLAGQAACLRYLREVLQHFLSDAEPAASGILQVTRISKGRLEAAPVDVAGAEASLLRGETESEEQTRLAAYQGDVEPGGRLLDRWSQFVAADGRQLRISATLEPVYELKGFTRIGFRMIRRVIVVSSGEELTPQQVSALAPIDLLRADLATITRGVDRLGAAGGEQQLSLIVPVSFSSLASQRGRAELTEPLKEAGSLVKLGVVCEILDIEGVPPAALLTATTLVRPFSLLVAGRLDRPGQGAVARLQGGGLQALSFECPQGMGDAEFFGWSSAAITAARKLTKSVLVYGASSTQRAGTLASLGASHVSIVAG
jgi:hypothetical protein